ncbi:MAG: hypothetical protein WKH47_06305 [Actinomycetes bacterium]
MPAARHSRPSVSSIQLMSNALAAVTAAVVGSRLGIAGTLVGAAAGSVIATTGTAMYGHWLDRTASRVRTVVRLPAARTSSSRTSDSADATVVLADVDDSPSEPAAAVPRPRRQPTWRTVGLAAAATFVVAIGSITAFEAIVGEPVSTLTGADAGGGTTLGRAVDPGPAAPPADAPAPVPTSTGAPVPTTAPTPASSPTPTPTSTPAPTQPSTTPPITPGQTTAPPTGPTTPPSTPA